MKIKKLLSVVLALVMVVAMPTVSFAAEEDNGIMPCYEYIFSCTAGITASGTSVTASSSVTVDSEYDVSITVELQSSANGENGWEPEGTYYPTVEKYLNINTASKTIDNVVPGLYYRAYITIKIYDSHGRRLETENIPSNVVYVP